MKFTMMRLLHRTPGLRSVSRRIHPVWFFRWTYCSVALSNVFWPHTKKLALPFRRVANGHFDKSELAARSRRYLLYLRLFKDLECAWSNWEGRDDWLSIVGEEHLANALRQEKGAILLSCHNFGFSKLVAPALSRRGYVIQRAGAGKKGGRRVSRWGSDYRVAWQYLDHKGDYWHRLQSLKTVRAALAQNHVVHISPRAYDRGEKEMRLDVFDRKYFLDARWFRLFQLLRVPVLPCFAIAAMNGKVPVIIHPVLPTQATPMGQRFAQYVMDYLKRFPECGRLWKAVYLKREQW